MASFVVRRIDAEDAAALERAREFARTNLLSRALLHASLEEPRLRAHSQHWWAVRDGHVVGLVARIDGFFPYGSAPLAALLPGAGAALLRALDRPFDALAPELLWPELERAGGRRVRSYLQVVRFAPTPLPDPDPAVKPVDDPDELAAFFGAEFSAGRAQMGPFFGVRDEAGQLVAAGGVEFVTDALAQLARVETREARRREGLARTIVVELIRVLETRQRRVVLQVRSDNRPANSLYAALDFRGSRRLGRYRFE